jgi:hypothetical protein
VNQQAQVVAGIRPGQVAVWIRLSKFCGLCRVYSAFPGLSSLEALEDAFAGVVDHTLQFSYPLSKPRYRLEDGYRAPADP